MRLIVRGLLAGAIGLLAGSKNLWAQTSNSSANRAVYTYVEQMPQFPGGQQALFQELSQTLVYPTEALRQQVTGTVFVKFVVSVTGSIQEVQVVKPLNPLLDAEAVRAVAALPSFVPGKQLGRPVPVSFTLPIRFVLPADLDRILAQRDSLTKAQALPVPVSK